jgi:hypothetical protein
MLHPFTQLKCYGQCCQDVEGNILFGASWKLDATQNHWIPGSIGGLDQQTSNRLIDLCEGITVEVEKWIEEHNRIAKERERARQKMLLVASYGCMSRCCCILSVNQREDESRDVPVFFGEGVESHLVPITRQRSKVE